MRNNILMDLNLNEIFPEFSQSSVTENDDALSKSIYYEQIEQVCRVINRDLAEDSTKRRENKQDSDQKD